LFGGVRTSSFHLAMRDGVRVAVDLSLPVGLEADAKIPAILYQTRYFRAFQFRWPLSLFLRRTPKRDFRSELVGLAVRQGFAWVDVDVRGSGASFGTQPHPWSEAALADAGEIVDWIVSQPWSNGNVGGFGVSYSGTAAEL